MIYSSVLWKRVFSIFSVICFTVWDCPLNFQMFFISNRTHEIPVYCSKKEISLGIVKIKILLQIFSPWMRTTSLCYSFIYTCIEHQKNKKKERRKEKKTKEKDKEWILPGIKINWSINIVIWGVLHWHSLSTIFHLACLNLILLVNPSTDKKEIQWAWPLSPVNEEKLAFSLHKLLFGIKGEGLISLRAGFVRLDGR